MSSTRNGSAVATVIAVVGALLAFGALVYAQLADHRSRSEAFEALKQRCLQMGDKTHTSAWAHAIHTQFGGDIDGLLHRSSVDNELMITLFQRSNDSFPKRPDFNELLTDPACDPVILEACRTLNYTVV